MNTFPEQPRPTPEPRHSPAVTTTDTRVAEPRRQAPATASSHSFTHPAARRTSSWAVSIGQSASQRAHKLRPKWENLKNAIRRAVFFPIGSRGDFYHLMAGQLAAKKPLKNLMQQFAAESHLRRSRDAKALTSINRALQNGKPLQAACAGWLPPDELLVIQAADRDAEVEAFDALFTMTEATREIRGRLAAALMYPVSLIGTIFVAIPYLNQEFLKQVAGNFPIAKYSQITQYWIKSVQFVDDNQLALIAAALAAALLTQYAFAHLTGPVRRVLDIVAFPFAVYRELAASRFLLCFMALYQAKTPLPEAIRVLYDASAPYLQDALRPMHQAVRAGHKDERAFRTRLLQPGITVALANLLGTSGEPAALKRIVAVILRATYTRIDTFGALIRLAAFGAVGVFILTAFFSMYDISSVTAGVSRTQ